MDKELIRKDLDVKLRSVKPRLPNPFPPDDHFKDDWGLDSLDLVEFVARVEQHFQIMIPDQALEQFTTLNRVVDYISNRQSTPHA